MAQQTNLMVLMGCSCCKVPARMGWRFLPTSACQQAKRGCWITQPCPYLYAKVGLPTVALGATLTSRLRGYAATAGNLRLTGERRLVDQNIASWNPLISWLQRIERLKYAN
jgi:hypothetical protein